MDYKVNVSLIAITNIREAVAYYKESATIKVAKSFVKEYESNVKNIVPNPFYQVHYRDHRVKPMRKFPYIIFYTLDEYNKIIYIKAVFNTPNNPINYPKL
ncbi:type II toxin-antitoxin system RelE/ParE family toxin [uncultured Empedobacter sp.]|uniref:type II toxin-antitoxin system RelE/ParE family toxin n=1 Tax=uncultured Empedobacter sp. TaxID=410844 RepID=UPI00263779B6|nr:type II toxin-antitoxin system RelE/ParE family toxin [uncultured Empedobacter sp.]